jgi:UDP-N-acetylmuramate dehydrogenase
VRSTVKRHELLAPYTTWHVGGAADYYYRPQDIEDLSDFLKEISPQMPITWLGLGSNVLISDQGLPGVVIHFLSSGANILQEDPTMVKVCAHIPAAKLAKFCVKAGLVGGEFFAGIPGTIGGALAMNAGAWGSETWEHVVRVEVINRLGERTVRYPKEYQIGYRSVLPLENREEWFVAGYFQFNQGESVESQAQVKSLLKIRNEKQPIGVFSGGSVFINPEPHYAGQLIESADLKGYCIGDAEVSQKHANFIINRGKASAGDIWQLIKHVQQVVKDKHNIELKTEVKILGEFD